jgi:hypothetical protein
MRYTKRTLGMMASVVAALGVTSSASALDYNQNITAIFGSGNPDQGWTTFVQDNIQLGLRAKNRTDGTTPNDGAGTYSFPVGTAPASTRALWNFEFSANVNYNPAPAASLVGDIQIPPPKLADYTYLLSVDTDPSGGTSFISYNPLVFHSDNSYGNNATLNGAGVEVGPLLGSAYSMAQNSQNITFFPFNGNPLISGTYDFAFGIYEGASLIGETKMIVVVGDGGTKNVPDGGSSIALLSLGCIGFGLFRRKIAGIGKK